MPDSELSVYVQVLAQFLGGMTDRRIQGFLLGRNRFEMTEDDCTGSHTQCVNAILTQHPEFQEPFDNDDFETPTSCNIWFMRYFPAPNPVKLVPIEQRPWSVHVAGFGRIDYCDFSTEVHAEPYAS